MPWLRGSVWSDERVGCDNLHLVYLNFFKHLFKYTCHENFPTSKNKMVRDYLRVQGFYSYDAASDDDDPVKCWIGREVKRFLLEAHIHLPFPRLQQPQHSPLPLVYVARNAKRNIGPFSGGLPII